MTGLYRNGTMQIDGPSFTGKTDYKVNDKRGAIRNAERYGANEALCESHVKLCDKATSGLGSLISVKSLAQDLIRKMSRPRGDMNNCWVMVVRQCAPFKIQYEEFVSNTQHGPVTKVRRANKSEHLRYKPAGMSSAEFEKQIGAKPTTNYLVWVAAMQELQRYYMDYALKFESIYPALLRSGAKAGEGLGKAWDASKWPTIEKVQGSYSMDWKAKIPSEQDAKALVNVLGMDVVEEQIKKQEEEMQANLSSYNADIIKMLAEPLTKYISALRDYNTFNPKDKKNANKKAPALAGAVIENILGGVEQAIGNTMHDDPKLMEICDRMTAWTTGAIEAEKELKTNKLTRDLHIDEGNDMLAELADLQDQFAGMAL
jgi:hypothetical protein